MRITAHALACRIEAVGLGAQRLEVHDVPALAQDLSGISKEIGAPIKALLGVNLLRHLNATIDYEGRQFVARSYAPPPPPSATRLNLHYVRGGGMIVRGTMGGEKGPGAALLVDTSRPFPLALDAGGWKKAGSTVESLKLVAGDPRSEEHTSELQSLTAISYAVFCLPRSEERRVGKECSQQCRSRWSPYH